MSAAKELRSKVFNHSSSLASSDAPDTLLSFWVLSRHMLAKRLFYCIFVVHVCEEVVFLFVK